MKTENGFFRVLCLWLLVVTFASDVAVAKIEAVLGSVALKGNPNLALMPSVSSGEIIISREQYVISYNPQRRSPNWVAWKVEASQLGSTPRANNFAKDPDLDKYLQQNSNLLPAVDPMEYRGTCFDRGHVAPSADRTEKSQDNQMTFLMSNMVPQTPFSNRKIWEQLEEATRDLVRQGKKVYIMAGPVYDENFGAIGPKGDIPVPSKNFKIIVVLEANQGLQDINKNTQVISVLIPNTLQNGSAPTNKQSLCADTSLQALAPQAWQRAEVPVADIERLAGLTLTTGW